MKCYIYVYYYLNAFYLVFDLYPYIHTQLDLYPTSAREISKISVPNFTDMKRLLLIYFIRKMNASTPTRIIFFESLRKYV